MIIEGEFEHVAPAEGTPAKDPAKLPPRDDADGGSGDVVRKRD